MNSNKKLLVAFSVATAVGVIGCTSTPIPSVNSTDNVIEFSEKYADADYFGPFSLDTESDHNHSESNYNYWSQKDCWNSSEDKAISIYKNFCNAHGGEFIRQPTTKEYEKHFQYEIKGGWCRNIKAPYQPLFRMITKRNVFSFGYDTCANTLTSSQPFYRIIVETPKTGTSNTDEEWINYAENHYFLKKQTDYDQSVIEAIKHNAQINRDRLNKIKAEEKRKRDAIKKSDEAKMLSPKYRGTKVCNFEHNYIYGSLEDANPNNRRIKVILSDQHVEWYDVKDWYICGHL